VKVKEWGVFMTKKLTNNQVLLDEYLNQEVRENTDYINLDEFFEFFAADQSLKNFDLSYDEIKQGILGSGLDGGCDSIYLFLNGMLVNNEVLDDMKIQKDIKLEYFIIQAKNTYSFGETTLSNWKVTSKNLFQIDNIKEEYSSRYSERVIDSFQLFKDAYIKLIRNKIKISINYLYVSKGVEIHPNVKSQSDELIQEIKAIFPNSNVTVSVEFIGADKLMDLMSSSYENNISLKLVEHPITSGSKKDYISLVNLGEYFNFITNEDGELLKHIFESNVRDYQGTTIVNTEIQESLQGEFSEDFWWLNNGITILATEAILATGKELIITDPEIVNGLQTSTEIYHYFSNNKDKVTSEKRCVLVRVIVPETEESRDRIILATNSQTIIPKSSLRATDPIHRQIEMYFKTRGLYYDRRKNYYKNQGKKAADIVSVSFLAQCLMSLFLQKPDYARARPSTLLTNDDSYSKLYIENQGLDSFFKAAYLGKKLEHSLNSLTNYPTVEKGDILFYLIYSVVAIIIGKIEINSNDLSRLDVTNIKSDLIDETILMVYTEYKKLGGNGKVAKSSELTRAVQEKIQEMISSTDLSQHSIHRRN
jgi:hypothetical protein